MWSKEFVTYNESRVLHHWGSTKQFPAEHLREAVSRKCLERITNLHILTFAAQVPSWSSFLSGAVMHTYCKQYLHDLSQVQLCDSKYCSGTKFLWSFVCTSHICMCGCWSFQCSAFRQVFFFLLFDLNGSIWSKLLCPGIQFHLTSNK